ncbi:D-alanyl-D-alanine carboxypeptidase [Thermocatellispora tengchongensis]|uniref:D-alanyl-D-alanine carboxypeptidase n=1 Tax=Thermocatellispora tengchongensis TaxID=1073253 RepID=A0A840PKX4_9ACTN|nr:serine hydrolase domain-containing protein [Thermocatellispora tengchongensis]MBB5136705.1 D-alanyl-D-alanine carboxypeptidase [Thermocatellispora tengchongensis]
MFVTHLALVATLTTAINATPEYGRPDLRRDAERIVAGGVTGVQARVTGGGRSIVATAGVADLRTKSPVPSNGYFRIGSSNKALVATVVLQLAGEGKLSLDDTVDRWLPGLIKGRGNDGRKITVRDLLQHTSGIVDDYPYPAAIASSRQYRRHWHDTYTPQQVISRAMRHKPAFAPGKGWLYSNTGYAALGLIIEKATGRSWHAEVKRRVIEPLGLKHTRWPAGSAELPRPHARGYSVFKTSEGFVDTTRHRDADASGGFISTTADLDRFFTALLGGELLRPRELAEMRKTVPVATELRRIWPGARYGLGLVQRPLPCGGTYWGHGGDILGFMTRTGVTADGKRSVVISVSTERFDSAKRALQIEDAVDRLVNRALCGGSGVGRDMSPAS